MPRKELGRASYRAFRLFGQVHLVATGETNNLNNKFDFEQLPFRIFPPMYGFFVITPDVTLPATTPFVHHERILFPSGVNVIRIQDADGIHEVPIAEVVPHDMGMRTLAAGGGNNLCVFSWIGINSMMIAECNAVVPAVYTKVFGPASQQECENYIASHGGGAFRAASPVTVIKQSFHAWIDRMPMGGPRLFVTGDIVTPSGGWTASLTRAVPQGINPNILILQIDASPPTGGAPTVMTTMSLRFEEAPPAHPYTDVTIRHGGGDFTIEVGETH
jgi:hypothetical protein